VLRVDDDGQGLAPGQREALERALAEHDCERLPGLGLVLADVVARAHGGAVSLPASAQGFTVQLQLGQPNPILG
jgi:hypothetical protein